jgi:hypothetical protein
VLGIGLALGYPSGRRFLRGPAAPLLGVLLGLALLSLIVCLLSWLRWFAGWSVIVVTALALAASARCLRADLPQWRQRWRSRPAPSLAVVTCFSVLLIALVGFSVLALYPANGFDATSYHLPLARDLVRHHGLTYDPFVRYSFFPQAGESIFAVMLLLSGNPIRSSALEFSALAVVVLLLPCWFVGSGRTVGAGFVAGIVVLASPVVVFCGVTDYVDTWTMGFVLAGLLVGLDGAADGNRPRGSLVLMGAFLGEAAASKYTGVLFGACVVVGVLVATPRSPLALLRDLGGAVGGFCLLAVPWYAWTVHTTGDPVYPFAIGLFGNRHGLWTAWEISFQDVVARASPQPGFSSILHQALQYLAGDISYDTGLNRSPLSWLLGAGVFGLAVPSARRDRAFLGVLFAEVLCIAASLQLSADPRYTVPAVGPLAVAAGLVADHAMSMVPLARLGLRWRAVLTPAAFIAAAVVGLWTSAGYARDVYGGGKPPISGHQVDGYLAARIPCYTAVGWLNQFAGPSYRAWGYVCEEVRYYAHGLLISDTFSVGSRPRIFDDDGSTLPSAAVLWQRLAPLHVGWMILPAGTPPNPETLEQGRRFTLVTTTGTADIYRVARGPV